MSDVENPYKVLGVERSADERAVKKAYVALVRKFSPEKHPEEFKKIRAAYELLLDPTARARFDEGEKGYAEYGEELSRRLEDVDKANSDGNTDLAREILLPLAEKFPDVTVVKEKLGFLHLNAGEHERAIDVFAALVAKEPENARHLLHSAFALARLERHPQVEKSLREALRLEPKNVRVGLAFIDFLIERGRTVEAIKIADDVIPLLEPNSVQVAVFLLRQLEADATGGHDVTVAAETKALRELFRTSKEDNIGPFIAGQIASTAAKLFAMKNPSAANRLLVLCAEFDPSSALVWPLPSEVKVRPEDLPAKFREWLEHLSQDLSAPFVLRHPTSLVNAALVLLACGVFVAGAFMVGGATSAANVTSIVFALVVVIAGGAGVVLAFGRLLRERGGKLRTITTLHPLYLIRATPSLVELYPLFMLTGTSGSHQPHERRVHGHRSHVRLRRRRHRRHAFAPRQCRGAGARAGVRGHAAAGPRSFAGAARRGSARGRAARRSPAAARPQGPPAAARPPEDARAAVRHRARGGARDLRAGVRDVGERRRSRDPEGCHRRRRGAAHRGVPHLPRRSSKGSPSRPRRGVPPRHL